MSHLGLILRWTAALFIAVIVHIAALGLGAVLWRRFGGDAATAVSLMVTAGTLAAVLAGTLVLPRERWRTGAFVIWMLALIAYLWPLVYYFSALNLETFGAALIGGTAAYLSISSVARTTRQQSHYENESIIGPFPRPIRKLGLAFLILFACGVVFVAVENLYSALRYHAVMGRHADWISYSEHPIEFWWVLLINFGVLVFVLLLALLKVREGQRLRKRETRPPLENIIRQSISER
jgi:hypothetical protein